MDFPTLIGEAMDFPTLIGEAMDFPTLIGEAMDFPTVIVLERTSLQSLSFFLNFKSFSSNLLTTLTVHVWM